MRTEYNRIAACNPRFFFLNRRVGRHNQKVSLEGEVPVAKGARTAMVFGRVPMRPCPGSQSTEKQCKSPVLKALLLSNLLAFKWKGGNRTEPLCKDKDKKNGRFKNMCICCKEQSTSKTHGSIIGLR